MHIISTSLGWYNLSPGDGTGFFANLVQSARTGGIFWTTAASNDRQAHWAARTATPTATTPITSPVRRRSTTSAPATAAFTTFCGLCVRVFLRWDDWSAKNQNYSLSIVRWNGSSWDIVKTSNNLQNGGAGQTPTEYASYVTSGSATPYGFIVQRVSSNRNVNMEIFAPKVARLDEIVTARSLANLADSPGAMTVAALDVNAPYPQESYSSEGPTNGPGGTASGGAIKPDIAAFANVSTASYPNPASKFNGTSAATPHVAGAAALVKGANPGYTPAQIQSFLEGRAVDMGAAGKDTIYGYGRLHLGAPPGRFPFVSTFLRVVGSALVPEARRGSILDRRDHVPGAASTIAITAMMPSQVTKVGYAAPCGDDNRGIALQMEPGLTSAIRSERNTSRSDGPGPVYQESYLRHRTITAPNESDSTTTASHHRRGQESHRSTGT